MKVLELFSGIGAVSAAFQGIHQVACAVDINLLAKKVFQTNFDTPVQTQEITSITDEQFREFDAEFWWMSPPCQPFTRRGLQKDIEDPRTAAMLRVIEAIKKVRPQNLALENVIGFEGSRTHELLCDTLQKLGYQITQLQLCSSEFGIPNLRPRFFLAASLAMQPRLIQPTEPQVRKSVEDYLDPDDALPDGLTVSEVELKQYFHAVNIVNPSSKTTRCFTSAYGRSNVRSGSYLQTEQGFRRFSPREIARFLGLPEQFILPADLSINQLWKLLGNAVSVPSVRHVGTAFQEGQESGRGLL